jgi:glycosyltransferase involved in cell wall biosynthesis
LRLRAAPAYDAVWIPLNVLLLHNAYREPGGEERSVAAIATLLRTRGHDVAVLERSSSSLSGLGGTVHAGAAMLAGGLDAAEVGSAVARHRADVVHAHNLHPLFGARALRAARRAGARVVLHVHNYRLVCAIAIQFRDGRVCTRCTGRNTWPGIRLRCRGNLPEALAYGAGLALHQRSLLEAVDTVVVPSDFVRERLLEVGVPLPSAKTLPNFVPAAELASAPTAEAPRHALFAGRLVPEKGVDTAIEAAARAGVPLAIAGSGPDEAGLRALASRLGAPVRFLGRLSQRELAETRRAAAFSVLPSRWDEPCPYAALESMGAGVPVIASAVGGLPEVVGRESVVPAGDPGRWAEAMGELWSDAGLRRRRAEAARDRARELFGEDRFYSGLMDVYGGRG